MDELEIMHSISERMFHAPEDFQQEPEDNQALYAQRRARLNSGALERGSQVTGTGGDPDRETSPLRFEPPPSEPSNEITSEPSNEIIEESLYDDKEFVKASTQVFELYEGRRFDGTAEEAVDYGLEVMGEFAFNFFGIPGVQPFSTQEEFSGGGMLAQAATIINSGEPENAQAFLYLLSQYERLPTFSFPGTARMFRGLMNDPTTIAGAFSGGLPLVLKQLGLKKAAGSVRKVLKAVAENSFKAGAGAGAVYAGGGEAAQIGVERAAGEEVSDLEAALRTGISSVAGAGVGGTAAKVLENAAPVVGKIITDAGDAARARLEGGTRLGSGLDTDQVLVALSDAVRLAREAYEASPNDPQLRREYLEARKERDAVGEQIASEGAVSYRMQHQSHGPEDGAARLDDMTGAGTVFPDDIYSPDAVRLYGGGNIADAESAQIIQSVRHSPDADVTIYRAVPEGVDVINPGDFVTLSKRYAEDHAASGYGEMGDEAGKVISQRVKVRDVYSDGNDLNEFGYFPSQQAAPNVSPDVIKLSESARMGTLIDELYGEGVIEPGGKLYDVAKKINDRSKAGGDRSAQTSENQEIIANMMAKEILHAMEAKGNAADWYKTKITNAMKIAERIYPDLADPTEASVFKFITAITSNGADVASNMVNAVDAYGQYKKTGKMPIIGYGREKPSMQFSFNLFNELEEQLGSKQEVFKLLNMRMKVRDLEKLGAEYGFKVSGENKDTIMPASVMFGPKIGGAFYQNLEGNFDMLTMDRWFMRMWGRMSGTLISERSLKTLAKQQARIRAAITPEAAENYGFVYDDLINDDTVLADFADVVHRKYRAGGFKDKNELTRSTKALDEGSKKVLEDPGSGGNRSYMRATVDRAVNILRDNGLKTDAASAQALLWYPEKELYAKLGVGNKKSAPTDYEAELAKLARQRGIDVSDITGEP